MEHTSTHPHQHIQYTPCCYKRWTLGEVSIENGKISLASAIDLLLSTFRHSLLVRVHTCLRYRIHSKPLSLLKRLYVSNPPPNLVPAKAGCELIAPIWRIMQEKTRLSPDSVAQPTAANGCRSCDKSTLTSSKLIRRQADCWQLIILATPISRGHCSNEGKEKKFSLFCLLLSLFLLSCLTAGLQQLNLEWTWLCYLYISCLPPCFFLFFFFFEKFVIQWSSALFCGPYLNRWYAQGYLLNRSSIISLTFKAFTGVDGDLKSLLAQQG